MKERKFKCLDDTNLSDATKVTYNVYFNSLFAWSNIKSQDEFLKLSDKELQTLLEDFLEYQKQRVKDNLISPNSVPKFFKPYKYLLDINYREHAVMWKPISKLYPKQEKKSGFRPWTTDQIYEMIQVVSSFVGSMAMYRNRATIYFHSSTGSRVGVHNEPLLCKHMIKMTHPDFAYHFYAILIYADVEETVSEKDQRILNNEVDDEDYSKFVFLIPEAARALDEYHNYRKNNGEVFDDDTPIFSIVKEFDKRIPTDYKKQMSGNAFRHVMEYVLAKSNIVRQKKRNRYSTMIDHAFRKRFNTILKINKSINSNIAESLMQHSRGLDGAYLKPTREQQFTELVKAVSELTIDPTERQKDTIKTSEGEIIELKIENQKLASKNELNAKMIKHYEPMLERLLRKEEQEMKSKQE